MKFTMHSFALPSGMNDVTCRNDGIIQIGNTEVTPEDVAFLAAHIVEECEIVRQAKLKKAKRR